MSKLWEVDPETRAKLLDIQKQNGNGVCVDCSAPSPQWASPKFGIFMCLNCSGIHRGLGVHITFIRSVTMDSFKVAEIRRMQLGGNRAWQDFFDAHADNQLDGKTFQDATIKERYDSDVGEEWKERLTAKVEGTEYVPGAKGGSGGGGRSQSGGGSGSVTPATGAAAAAVGAASEARSQSGTPVSRGGAGTPLRSASPAVASGLGGGLGRTGSARKTQNEAYFAQKGHENASRPDHLPPSQGGKYAGFGSSPAPGGEQDDGDWLAEMGKDPLAGLTKGFGWLGKSAKTVYDGSIKPNVQKLAESDFTSQARLTAAQVAQNLQSTSKTATDSFNRFVDGTSPPTSPGPDADKREFWDSFGAAAEAPPSGAAGQSGHASSRQSGFWSSLGAAVAPPPRAGPEPERKDFWDSFGAAPRGPDKDKKDFWDAFSDAGAAAANANAGRGASGGQSAAVGTSAMKSKKKDDEWGEW